MTDDNHILEVRRDAVGETRLVAEPVVTPGDGQVRVEIERFALTANNVTYAVAGDMLGYWDFYPTELPWGRVPAMGWARVVESAHPDVTVGSRYYGWFPMARSVTTTVAVTNEGLRDDGEHRLAHAPVYRSWVDAERDPLHQDGIDAEERHALLRGLFLTGFLIDASLGEAGFHGASTLYVTSASSKTSIGLAWNAALRDGLRVVGLTSPGNVDFVRALGLYDEVVAYGDIASLPVEDAVLVDMAGNAGVVAAVHGHFGDRLQASLIVGSSHHDAEAVPVDGGPDREFFFAPTAIGTLQGSLGAAEYAELTRTRLHQFVDDSGKWLELEHPVGPAAVREAWARLVAGDVPPTTGIAATMG